MAASSIGLGGRGLASSSPHFHSQLAVRPQEGCMAYRMDACPCSLGSMKSYPTKMTAWTPHPGLFLQNPLPSFRMLQGQHHLSRERQETVGRRLRMPRSPGGSSPVGPGIQALQGVSSRARAGQSWGTQLMGRGGLRNRAARLHQTKPV